MPNLPSSVRAVPARSKWICAPQCREGGRDAYMSMDSCRPPVSLAGHPTVDVCQHACSLMLCYNVACFWHPLLLQGYCRNVGSTPLPPPPTRAHTTPRPFSSVQFSSAVHVLINRLLCVVHSQCGKFACSKCCGKLGGINGPVCNPCVTTAERAAAATVAVAAGPTRPQPQGTAAAAATAAARSRPPAPRSQRAFNPEDMPRVRVVRSTSAQAVQKPASLTNGVAGTLLRCRHFGTCQLRSKSFRCQAPRRKIGNAASCSNTSSHHRPKPTPTPLASPPLRLLTLPPRCQKRSGTSPGPPMSSRTRTPGRRRRRHRQLHRFWPTRPPSSGRQALSRRRLRPTTATRASKRCSAGLQH